MRKKEKMNGCQVNDMWRISAMHRHRIDLKFSDMILRLKREIFYFSGELRPVQNRSEAVPLILKLSNMVF